MKVRKQEISMQDYIKTILKIDEDLVKLKIRSIPGEVDFYYMGKYDLRLTQCDLINAQKLLTTYLSDYLKLPSSSTPVGKKGALHINTLLIMMEISLECIEGFIQGKYQKIQS